MCDGPASHGKVRRPNNQDQRIASNTAQNKCIPTNEKSLGHAVRAQGSRFVGN